MRCPGCGSERIGVFYELRDVPVHSVTLVPTRNKALAFPRGDIALGACRNCGFIYNTAFDPALLSYHADYEPTQAYSATFNAFHKKLAERLMERYDLNGKQLIEIGCGHGEFLTLLCEMGGNRGTGFDPAYLESRNGAANSSRATFVKDYYSEQYSHYEADFLCCKMTLEHLADTSAFVRTVRRALGGSRGTTVFFQVPNARRILREAAFWDIYYEHCSYFTAASLRHLFEHGGFDVTDVRTEYGDQYLTIEATPGEADDGARRIPAMEPTASIEAFATHFSRAIENWRYRLGQWRDEGRRVVLWGGGSKAVAFLSTVGVDEAIHYAVDINPHKHGTFLAGAGQQVVAPDFLRRYHPDAVIVMNPIYRHEIRTQLQSLGVAAELLSPNEAGPIETAAVG